MAPKRVPIANKVSKRDEKNQGFLPNFSLSPTLVPHKQLFD